VLFNLLNNAARFTDQGSITIKVSRRDAGLVFAVTDTGMGIAPEDIPHIFEEFRQIDGSARRRHSGAGLGLVISKQFIELHGGSIWVESEGVPGQGSTFYFSLPVSETDLGTTSSGLGKVTHLVAGRSEEPIVLAVTRSPLAVALLTRYIQRGHTIVVQDLEQAGQVVQQSKPQVIVIDKACCEGLDPTKMEMLGREWGLRHTPIVVCPLPGEEPLRQQLAVDGYLLKPISRQGLWDTLRQFGEKTDRILVIDDDQDFILLLSRILEDNPIRRYQVISADNGQEGLALIRNRRPDLILLDLMLPDITGFQIIEHVRSNPIWRHIPIVVVSAQDDLDARETLTGAMMVAKPNGLRTGEVVRWVQNVLDATTQEPPPEDQIILSPTPSAPRVMPVL
jgi:CheY-like chemotaxis protein